MAKFVELHYDGDAMLVNLDKVQAIASFSDGVQLLYHNDTQEIDESYEEVKQLIGEAQGGIPMEPGRTYDGA